MSEKMTLQDAFNKIWERAKDPRKSYRNPAQPQNSVCAYRSPDGLRCFIGVLLPDVNYDPRMDRHEEGNGNFSYTGLQYVGPFLPIEHSPRTADALFQLQRVHDSHEPAEWQASLRRLAVQYALTVPENV